MALEDLPLLQEDDFELLGSFTLDDAVNGYFSFGGFGMSYDPSGNSGSGSLFMGGHQQQITFGEISVPALSGQAAILQVPTVPPNRGLPSGDSLDQVGGSLIYDNRLVLSMFLFYDANANVADRSHWYGSNKTVAALGSPVKVGSLNPGYYGYMAHVPAEWQTALGGPAVVGQCGISNVQRTSWGPSAFSFDPADIGVTNPVPATPLVYYTEAHPLHDPAVLNDLYNHTAAVGGVIIAPGTRSAIFVGRMGMGLQCYGTGGPSGGVCVDPANSEQGYHAYPYEHRVWAYDLLDLVAVKAGSLQPWEPQPYAMWELPGMATPTGNAAVPFGGAAYDPATRKIYFMRGSMADNSAGGNPTVFVWQHADVLPPDPPVSDGGALPLTVIPILL